MKKLLSIFFTVILSFSFLLPACVSSETQQDESEEITYYAVSTNVLKMRREPDMNASACGSIDKNTVVNIIEYGDTWCKVKKYMTTGWILTKYLKDIVPAVVKEESNVNPPVFVEEDEPEAVVPVPVNFTMNQENYTANYKASTVSACMLYSQPDLYSNRVCNIECYKDLTVGEISGDWCLCSYNGFYGFTLTEYLFKWDRLNPYCGDIPGLDVWDTLAFVNQSTDVYDYDTGECLKTINPGAAIAAAVDKQGRYKVGYYRQYGYVMPNHIAYTINTVPYDQAQSGDLLSVMTTYYPVGIHTLQQQGRNWNIRLSSTFITGTVLQPGQTFNMNQCIAPYAKSTGYMSAPIMSPNALTGYGGGTCQVNTTFYNATIALPLLVTHRRVHADVGIYYCKKGFDAAVGGGSINLTMQNTLPYAIRYQMYISDGVLTCCIYKN